MPKQIPPTVEAVAAKASGDMPLTVDEAALFLGVHPRTVRAWIRDHGLPAHVLGKGAIRLVPSELRAWTKASKRAGAGEVSESSQPATESGRVLPLTGLESCSATTASGDRCSRSPLPGQTLCGVHRAKAERDANR